MRHALDVVLLHELRPFEGLILRFVRHVEDFAARPHELLRRAVTLEAPRHRERLCLIHEIHAIDATMTAHAADSLRHVDAVIEVDEVRKPVDAAPDEWTTRRITLPH